MKKVSATSERCLFIFFSFRMHQAHTTNKNNVTYTLIFALITG